MPVNILSAIENALSPEIRITLMPESPGAVAIAAIVSV
jgi:hypothetical protein